MNCICPGYIDTGLAEGYFQSSRTRRLLEQRLASCIPRSNRPARRGRAASGILGK